MSRIHEALKKAEQERAASQGRMDQPSVAGDETAGMDRPAIDPPIMHQPPVNYPPGATETLQVGTGHASGGGIPLTSAMPSFASPFSLDTMLTRCPQLQWKPDEKTMLFFNGNDTTRGTEEYRTLRSRLYTLRDKMVLKKVLVTSALPKEGKSFTAANLAQVLVKQHGRRVLLIDADLRSPRLHTMLGTTESPGLSDYLKSANDEFSVMQRGPMENLFFIPCGSEISEPAELVSNGRLELLFQRLEALFDWIIVDSPPAVPVSDARMLAKACDGVLMVVRSNSTPSDIARRAREEFPDEALVGVVLNGTDTAAAPYTRYYYDAYQK
ncbi:MAG: tyrosine-protein kinase family protein [Candidatus Sulfotelmatobacter sp.]